jgi:DHA1 family tetracycline resistance protein-like MFS transporter
MSIHGLVMLFAGPWWGALSETVGRRRVILIGASLYTISILMFGLVIQAALGAAITGTIAMWLLIASRSVFAIGAGAVIPASMALAADLSSRPNRLKAMSLLATAVSTGAILGPATSAFFAGLGLAAPFYIIAACGLLVLVTSRAKLPIIRPTMHTASPSFRNLLRGRVLLIAVASWFFMCGTFGIFSVLGFRVQDHFSLDALAAARFMGLGLMGAAAVNVVMQSVVIRQLKMGTKALVVIGVPITIASFVLVWSAGSEFAFVAALMLNGFGQSFVNPAFTTALSLSVGASGQGRLAGLSTSTQALAFLLGPVSAAIMYAAAPLAPFIVGSIMTIVAMGLMLAVPTQTAAEADDSRQ